MEKRSLPAVLDSLTELRRYVKDAADGAGIDAAKSYQLQLAVDEIATNAIVYGYRDVSASAVILISGEMRDGVLVITLEDRGQTFDPRYLSRIGVFGVRGDPTAAAEWYQRARDLGDSSADARLQTLKTLMK